MKNYLIDTHAHLDFPELYNRLDEVLKNALENDVKRIVTISTNLNKIDKIIEISKNYHEVFFHYPWMISFFCNQIHRI